VVRRRDSFAMSVLRMRDSESERFSLEIRRLRAVCSRRFCFAPRFALSLLEVHART